MSICGACETVAHCSENGCITQSKHPAMAALIEEMGRNLAPESDEDGMSAAAVWILALIAGLAFVGLGFAAVVWMILNGG